MATGTLTGRVVDILDAPVIDPLPVLVATPDRITTAGTSVVLPSPVRVPFATDGTVSVDLPASAGWLWLVTVEVPGRQMPTWHTAIPADGTVQLSDLARLDSGAVEVPAPVVILDAESADAAAASAVQAATSATEAATSADAAGTYAEAAGLYADAAATARTLATQAAGDAADFATAAGAYAADAETAADAAASTLAAMPAWWTGTQAAYDALPVKSPTTLYLVTL